MFLTENLSKRLKGFLLACAGEWQTQEEDLQPLEMPLTTIGCLGEANKIVRIFRCLSKIPGFGFLILVHGEIM